MTDLFGLFGLPASADDKLLEVWVEEPAEVLHQLLHREDDAVHQDRTHRSRFLVLRDLVEKPCNERRQEGHGVWPDGGEDLDKESIEKL